MENWRLRSFAMWREIGQSVLGWLDGATIIPHEEMTIKMERSEVKDYMAAGAG